MKLIFSEIKDAEVI